jgi:hypothetical protein
MRKTNLRQLLKNIISELRTDQIQLINLTSSDYLLIFNNCAELAQISPHAFNLLTPGGMFTITVNISSSLYDTN